MRNKATQPDFDPTLRSDPLGHAAGVVAGLISKNLVQVLFSRAYDELFASAISRCNLARNTPGITQSG